MASGSITELYFIQLTFNKFRTEKKETVGGYSQKVRGLKEQDVPVFPDH